jgi:epoxyqueuosine reductase
MNVFDLKALANECGALSVACLDLNDPEFIKALERHGAEQADWLSQGYGADMDYLQRMLSNKIELNKTFPGAQSAIVITFANKWGMEDAEHPFPKVDDDALLGYISGYAKEQDYHRTGHDILTAIHHRLQDELGEFEAYPAVDTKPVFERFLAAYAGLGIIGPNDLLRTPERDVRVFIGTLFTTQHIPELILKPEFPFPCHFCRACEKRGCPTGAIKEGQEFDSRLCISYLTIEKKGLLNHEQRELMEDWLFGCDWCSIVCPPKEKEDNRIAVDLDWLMKSSAGEIRRLIKGTAVEYAGVQKLRRNAIAILRKSQDPRAQELLAWCAENMQSDLLLKQISCD